MRTCLYILLFFPLSAYASLTLEKVLLEAKSHSPRQKIIAEDVKYELAVNEGLLSNILPRLDLDVSASLSSQSHKQSQFAINPGVTDRVQGTDYRWKLMLTSPLYSYGFSSLRSAYNKRKDLLNRQLDGEGEQFLLEVLEAYNALLLSLHSHESSVSSASLAKDLLARGEIDIKHGKIDKIDYLRAKSFHDQTLALVDQKLSASQSAEQNLRILLGWSDDKQIVIDKTLKIDSQFFIVPDEQKKQEPYLLELSRLRRDISEDMRDYYKAQYLPTLGLFGGVEASAQDMPDFKLENSPGDLFDSDFLSYQVGVSITWNLFDGWATTSSYRQFQADSARSNLQYELHMRENNSKSREAKDRVKYAKKLFLAQQKSTEAARLYLDKVSRDLDSGSQNLSVFLEAERDWRNSLEDVYKAYVATVAAVAQLRQLLGINLIGKM